MAATIQTAHELEAVPTLVVGLGKSGLSAARFLVARGVPVAVTDSRDNPPGLDELRAHCPQVSVSVGGFDEQLFAWAQRLVVSPGISIAQPLIVAAGQRGVEVIGDVEIFARLAEAPIAAITGSNGKSTVTALLGQMVSDAGKQVQVGGNIGTPVLDLLDQPVPDCYVLELSSFQLETTRSLAAQTAVVLNVSPDHMDRYRDVAHYAASKQVIYHDAAVSVVNRDDAMVMAMAQGAKQVVSFGLGAPAANQFGRVEHENEVWLARGSEPLLPVSQLRIVGEHNQANALAALALGEALGLPLDSMLHTLQHFAGLPHRTQWVAEINGVAWYNDSKGTNVGATLSALQGLPGPLVLIAGGQGKGADFIPLRGAVADKVRAVVLIGEDAQQIAAALNDAVPVVFADSMSDAVQQAQHLARPGDAVLLSPACASFDMFNGFEHRGEMFFAAVKALGKGGEA